MSQSNIENSQSTSQTNNLPVLVGDIIEGSVLRIKPFGAIVKINDNTLGLVHISHISNKFIKDINEFLSEGDTVSAKVISIDPETKKIALSMKELEIVEEMPARPSFRQERKPMSNDDNQNEPSMPYNSNYSFNSKPSASSFALEDKIKDWVKLSNDKQAGINKRNKRR